MTEICKICNGDMGAVDGCTPISIVDNGKEYARFKVGEAGDYYAEDEPGRFCMKNGRCSDCNARMGHYHHMLCTNERCPTCGVTFVNCIISNIGLYPEMGAVVDVLNGGLQKHWL